MKRLPLLALTMLALSAMPVNADELSYALAYEAKIKQDIKSDIKYKLTTPEERLTLLSRLNADRDGVFDQVGAMKTAACAVSEKQALSDMVDWWLAKYKGKKRTASLVLNKRADYEMILVISLIPCGSK
jgi:hypothetical protein